MYHHWPRTGTLDKPSAKPHDRRPASDSHCPRGSWKGNVRTKSHSIHSSHQYQERQSFTAWELSLLKYYHNCCLIKHKWPPHTSPFLYSNNATVVLILYWYYVGAHWRLINNSKEIIQRVTFVASVPTAWGMIDKSVTESLQPWISRAFHTSK